MCRIYCIFNKISVKEISHVKHVVKINYVYDVNILKLAKKEIVMGLIKYNVRFLNIDNVHYKAAVSTNNVHLVFQIQVVDDVIMVMYVLVRNMSYAMIYFFISIIFLVEMYVLYKISIKRDLGVD